MRGGDKAAIGCRVAFLDECDWRCGTSDAHGAIVASDGKGGGIRSSIRVRGQPIDRYLAMGFEEGEGRAL